MLVVESSAKADDSCNSRLAAQARGNRDPGRYSLGSVTPSGQCWHLRGFLHLLEQQFVHAVADAIFKGPEVGSRYVVSGAGGDYCTGGRFPLNAHCVVWFDL